MPFIKPENALKRAEEFIDVGKKQRALDTLYEVIKSKKHRTWQIIHEPIMKNYLSLCVELKESQMAKDGLHQYKTICQTVNVKSLEDVINGYLQLAEEKAEEAKKKASDASEVINVDDLELLNSPESLLLKAVSGESSQDRTDRDLLAPWLKFVWESYKQCLDLLKNNNKVETIYQQVAKRAFGFCAKYQRKTEFRKLCETIRQHMVQSQKYGNQPTSIDLNKPETQNNHLETRLCQLNHAISMELWQEAYKAVEDIYSLMNLSRQKPKPGQMFNYYSKLSLIFWKAGNHLFHAATLQKLFILIKEQKKAITSDELTKISTRLLLATLAIPIPPNRSSIDEYLDQDDITQEKLKRLSSLLNLQQPPTRVSLLKDLAKYNVVQHVYVEIRDLYRWLEVDFHPLKLSERVIKCLDSIKTSHELQNEIYSQYVPAIKEICVIRLLKQVAQIYTTIEIQRFIKLAPLQMGPFQLEKLIVDAAKQLDLQVRINHQTKSLQFGNDLYVTQKDEIPEGPNIQSMPSELFRNQLITMTEQLQQAHELICYTENKKHREDTAQSIAHIYRQTCDKHHIDLLRRRQLIEEQKEMYERLVIEREQAEAERQRIEKDRLLAIPKSAAIQRDGQFRFPGSRNETDDRDKVEEDDIALKKQIEQANREKKELAERMKKEEKKYDHFIRACHEVEIPFIKKAAEVDQSQRKNFWDQKELERIENLKKEQLLHVENRERLVRMKEAKESFEEIIHKWRKEEFEKKYDEFQAKLKIAREAKMSERKENRKLERRAAYYKEIEDRKRREEDEKRAKEDEERRRKQDEQARKQREREREIEEKLLAREQEQTRDNKREVASSGVYKPPSAGGSGFTSIARRDQPRENAADIDSSWRRPTAATENAPYRPPGSRDIREDNPPYRPPTSRDYERRNQGDNTDNWRKRGDNNENRDRDRNFGRDRDNRGGRDEDNNWRRQGPSDNKTLPRRGDTEQKNERGAEGWTEVRGKK